MSDAGCEFLLYLLNDQRQELVGRTLVHRREGDVVRLALSDAEKHHSEPASERPWFGCHSKYQRIIYNVRFCLSRFLIDKVTS